MEILTVIISVFASIVSGTVLFFLQRYFKKLDERDKAAAHENILILKSINALGKLTVANSKALKEGKNNGELTSALNEYKSVDKELYDYLLERNAHK